MIRRLVLAGVTVTVGVVALSLHAANAAARLVEAALPEETP